MKTYTSGEVIRLTGASYRQLDYWTRHGFIDTQTPLPGSGYPRVWTDAQLAQVRLLVRASRLLRDGLTAAVDVLTRLNEFESERRMDARGA